MSLPRLFVAIRIQEKAIIEWPSAQQRLRREIKKFDYDVKWTLPGNFHVTLVFLGPFLEEKIPLLQTLLSSVAAKYQAFNLNIHGMGAFADVSHARLLYLGVQNKKILRSLQGEIMQVLNDESGGTFDVGGEVSDYLPHVTVLRFRNPHEVKELISPFLRKKWGEVEVSELVLYKSEMRGIYPIYTPIFSAALTGLSDTLS